MFLRAAQLAAHMQASSESPMFRHSHDHPSFDEEEDDFEDLLAPSVMHSGAR